MYEIIFKAYFVAFLTCCYYFSPIFLFYKYPLKDFIAVNLYRDFLSINQFLLSVDFCLKFEDIY